MKKLIWLAFPLPLNTSFINRSIIFSFALLVSALLLVPAALAAGQPFEGLQDQIDQEVQDRIVADDGLQQQIDQEAQDRIAADDNLQQQIDGLQDSGGSEPLPEDIRSFFASVTDTMGVAALIQNPGEQAFFVVTDIVLDGVGSTNQLKVRLGNPPTVLGEFWVQLDAQGIGRRQLSFESGIVATTQPGALSVNFISGNGRVDVTVTGYYFTP